MQNCILCLQGYSWFRFNVCTRNKFEIFIWSNRTSEREKKKFKFKIAPEFSESEFTCALLHDTSKFPHLYREETMGNAHFDLNAVRVLNRDALVETSAAFKNANAEAFLRPSEPARLFKNANDEFGNVQVVVRKRPLFAKEEKRGEFDVLSCGGSVSALGGAAAGAGESMWVHRGGIRLDGKHLFVDHHGFPFDAVFDENCDSATVYASAVAPLVEGVCASEGSTGHATVIAFGQTGTGKTFTMTHIGKLVVAQLFGSGAVRTVRFTAIEVAGDGARDLLRASAGADNSDDRQSGAVEMREGAGGVLHLVGVQSAEAGSAEELNTLLERCYAARATRETGVNDTSSRSHAVYRLVLLGLAEDEISQAPGAAVSNTGERRTLTLVDLAGSEWARDQATHDVSRRAEARHINKSLMTLKQCLRARIAADREAAKTTLGGRRSKKKKARMPIRESKLTRLLADCFLLPSARTLVIATVSPAVGDLEHSIETLRGGQGDVDKVSGWGMPRPTLLSSNVPGLAVCPERTEEEREEDDATTDSAVLAAAARAESPDPRMWTATQCCRWWTVAADAAFRAAVRAAAVDAPTEFEVIVGLIGDGKLGLSFEKAPVDSAAPVVSGINPKGFVAKAAHPLLLPGCRLVAVDGRGGATRGAVLGLLKESLVAAKMGADEGNKNLRLTFVAEPVEAPRMPPRVARIFTGESRLGISEGAQLCADFATTDLRRSKLVAACNKNRFVARHMWLALREVIREAGKVVE